MSDKIVLNAVVRSDKGKGASRRLRRTADLVPAIMYGAGTDPEMIALSHKEFAKAAENEAFFSSVLQVSIDGRAVLAILKDVQRHPAHESYLHADFLRVDMKTKLHVHVPLHFLNEEQCHGVKIQGGRLQHNMTDLEVSCLPDQLPEYIEVDMIDAQLGDIIHISDLKLPEGVESVALSHGEDHDLPVVSIVAPKRTETAEEEAGGETTTPAGGSGESEAG